MIGFTAFYRIAFVAGAALAAASGSARAQTQVLEYLGMCEVSAAVAAGPDHFFAAEDENSTVRLYARDDPKPLWSEDFSKQLEPDVKPKTKTDIEGAAAIGNRVYWITSHGRHKDGEERPQRQRFFATDIVGQGAQARLVFAGKRYTGLRDDLLGEKALDIYGLKAAAALPPEAAGGFNIEGLAATPEGKLLIGFRNPIRNGGALVVQLENPDEVVMQGVKARFGKAIPPLDLDGFGIRSIERVGNRYLILAGGFDDNSPEFSLRAWSGADNEKPQILPQPALADAKPPLVPEALFAIPGSNRVQILSDDGSLIKSVWNKECEDIAPEHRKFRSVIVTP